MPQAGSRYLIISIISTGLIVFLWVGSRSPLNPKHITLKTEEEVLALEDTMVSHYANKLKDDYQSPKNFREAIKEVSVLLHNFHKRVVELKDDVKDENILKVVASISAPVLDEQKLQASDIEIIKKSKGQTLVYISYNMIGSKVLGAIQIISLKEKAESSKNKKGSLEISLLQTALLRDSEVHGLTVIGQEDKQKLVITGQTSDPLFETPSFFEVFDLKNGVIQEIETSRVDLPSFAGTSVLHAHGSLFISVGDVGGGIVQLEKVNLLRKGIHKLKNLEYKFHELEDARDLAANNHSVYAVSGGQAAMWSKRFKGEGSRSSSAQVSFLDGGLIPEAKSSIEVSQSFAYIGLGDGGTKIISLSRLTRVGEIPQLIKDDLDSTLTVTNSVAVSGNDLFTADGEAGSRLFRLKGPSKLEEVAHIKFAPKTSVNSIKKVGDYIVFAVGLGGVKIVRHYR